MSKPSWVYSRGSYELVINDNIKAELGTLFFDKEENCWTTTVALGIQSVSTGGGKTFTPILVKSTPAEDAVSDYDKHKHEILDKAYKLLCEYFHNANIAAEQVSEPTSCPLFYYKIGNYSIVVNESRNERLLCIKSRFGDFFLEASFWENNTHEITLVLYHKDNILLDESIHTDTSVSISTLDSVEAMETIVLVIIYTIEYHINVDEAWTSIEDMNAREVLQTMPTIYTKNALEDYLAYKNRLYAITPQAGAEINAQSNGANPYPA